MSESISDYSNVNDSVLIRSELEELAEIESQVLGRKKDIIMAAADKLAMKYADNPSVVCTKLKSILSKDITILENGKPKSTYTRISPQYIMDILPAKYKQANSRRDEKKDDTPMNLFEEMLDQMCDCLDVASATTKNMSKAVKKLRETDKAEYDSIKVQIQEICTKEGVAKIRRYLNKQLSEIRNMSQFIDFIKDMQATYRSLQTMQDPRQKFITVAKLNLKLMFIGDSYDHLAAQLTGNKYGGKWMSMIDRDEVLKKFQKLVSCPNCNFDASRWYEKAHQNQMEGLDIPSYEDFVNKD